MVKKIFRLSVGQRQSLDSAADRLKWKPCSPTWLARAERLRTNGLLKNRGDEYSITSLGRLVLKAKPDARRWRFTAPNVNAARDVRQLQVCEVCWQVGARLPVHDGVAAHGACLVKHHGWAVLVELSESEFFRFRAEDFAFLGVTLASVNAIRKRLSNTR